MQSIQLSERFYSYITVRWRLHMLFWFCIIAGYVLVQPNLPAQFGWLLYSLLLFIKFSLIIAMVYINLNAMIPHFLRHKQYVNYILILLLLNFICASLLYLLDQIFHGFAEGIFVRSSGEKIYYFITQFISNFWYLGITVTLKFTRQHFEQRIQINKIEISRLQTEVKYLVAQMNPHFLFNAINTIYVQIDRNNVCARETVTKFSEMLRYQLYDCNQDEVSLQSEIVYLQNYIAIQRLRKSERHRIECSFPFDTFNQAIPPLLFIDFLENAFKYVSNEKGRDNYVKVVMELNDDGLIFTVENTVHADVHEMKTEYTGIGLKNIRRRLELQFKDRHTLMIQNEGRIHSVKLHLLLYEN